MKYLKGAIVMVLLLYIVGCTHKKDTLVMVTESGFAPYEFYKNGEIVGEGLVQYFDKTNNIVKIKNSKINITSKIDKIQKIKFDVLGLYNLNI